MHLKIPEYRLKFTQRSKWYGNPHELEMIHLGNADYVIKSKDH